MADSIPIRYAQSLLRLTPMSEQELRNELATLNLPMVLLQQKAAAEATISPESYGMEHLNWLPRTLQDPAMVRLNDSATLLRITWKTIGERTWLTSLLAALAFLAAIL